MSRTLDAVTFDHWNTLVYEERGHLRGRRLDAWVGILEEAGFGCERQQLGTVFDSSWEAYVERWKAGDQYDAVQAAEDCMEGLGFDLHPSVRAELTAAFTDAAVGAELHLTDGIETCLRTLKGAGVKLGIVCDVGMTASSFLVENLRRGGLLDLFDHWSFSDEVGFYKPDRRIFEHALSGLGVEAGRAAHVGDLRRTDIAGAQAVGMLAVRYTGVFDDDTQPEPEGDVVVADYAELPKALGVSLVDLEGQVAESGDPGSRTTR